MVQRKQIIIQDLPEGFSPSQLAQLHVEYDHFALLDSSSHLFPNVRHDFLCAIGATQVYDQVDDLKSLLHKQEWLFGHLAYDLKDHFEELRSTNNSSIGFAPLYFFCPRFLLSFHNEQLCLAYFEEDEKAALYLVEQIRQLSPQSPAPVIQWEASISKEVYLRQLAELKRHIARGDIYEVNFCQDFRAETSIEPARLYETLSRQTPTPFSGFYKQGERYLLCFSPERFLQKQGNQLISQPIKGTARRSSDPAIDQQIKEQLTKDPKERAENIMIVDLVRNDLSRIAKDQTVQVQELCELYSFPLVHQLISTVSCEIPEELDLYQILKATFPMGSMTGAPKISAMEIADRYENFQRNLFSGSIGYISPVGDFDFNVVIRSILYNEQNQSLSFPAGGAITHNSIPEQEYEECLVKIQAIRDQLYVDEI